MDRKRKTLAKNVEPSNNNNSQQKKKRGNKKEKKHPVYIYIYKRKGEA